MWLTVAAAGIGTALWWTSRRLAGGSFLTRLASMSQVVRLTQKIIEIISLMGDVAKGVVKTTASAVVSPLAISYDPPVVPQSAAPELVRSGRVEVDPSKHYTHTLNALWEARDDLDPEEMRKVFMVYQDHLGHEAIKSFRKVLRRHHAEVVSQHLQDNGDLDDEGNELAAHYDDLIDVLDDLLLTS